LSVSLTRSIILVISVVLAEVEAAGGSRVPVALVRGAAGPRVAVVDFVDPPQVEGCGRLPPVDRGRGGGVQTFTRVELSRHYNFGVLWCASRCVCADQLPQTVQLRLQLPVVIL